MMRLYNPKFGVQDAKKETLCLKNEVFDVKFGLYNPKTEADDVKNEVES